ncbi:MAG: hypothetical protein IKI64_11025 [Clostridia bacterium]|nr:hypothetical protein [Clostridia bacterium]
MMQKLAGFLTRLCVCCIVYMLLDTLLPRGKSARSVSTAAAKAAAIALAAAAMGI